MHTMNSSEGNSGGPSHKCLRPSDQKESFSKEQDAESPLSIETTPTFASLDDSKDTSPKATLFPNEEQPSNRRNKCFRCCHKWPRLCSLFFGVFLPLWFLIFVSIFLGLALASLEAPGEYERNDQTLVALMEATNSAYKVGNLTRVIPRVCWDAYVKQRRESNNESVVLDVDVFEEQIDRYSHGGYRHPNATLLDDMFVINGTEWDAFMSACGRVLSARVLEHLTSVAEDAVIIGSQSLSFEWVRCSPENTGIFSVADSIEEFRPQAQSKHYQAAWNEDQDFLQKRYYRQNIQYRNMTELEAIEDAFDRSIHDATGKEACDLHGPASAWFWFTVMTTVGYGNQAPITSGGRALVYTLGFVSILTFGLILAGAGWIVSVILDDGLHRIKLNNFCRKLLGVVVLGTFYGLWLLFMAGITREWKRKRLGEVDDFSWSDGYWFAYISTTTVGLGDYFLEPEVMLTKDLFVFSSIFLVGFTLLSAFIARLVGILREHRPTGQIGNMINEIQRSIREVDNRHRQP